ncbi:WV associated protein [Brazilian porcupinepox virus 1]|nr:WV associated protein [Brazilian porcupinepox virus 1]
MFKNTYSNDDIEELLYEYNYPILLCRTEYGKGIIIYRENFQNVKLLINIKKLDIIGITEKNKSYNDEILTINRLFIDELETDEYYSPKTSISPLIDILKKRSIDNVEIANFIDNIQITNKNINIHEINNLMCLSGLYRYRFINYKYNKDIDNDYTSIDEMSIMYIGKHYIWVKDKKYSRPEMDILPYNTLIHKKSVWSKKIPHNTEFISMFVLIVNGIITENGTSIYMITTHPGKCFINFNTTLLILDFLQWVREIMTNMYTIKMVSFLGELFDFPLLKSSLPKDCGWTFVDNNYIISDDGLKIILSDIYNFSNGMSLIDYCKHWDNKSIIFPKDFITMEEAMSKKKVLEKYAKKSALYLYNSITNHVISINGLFSPWDINSFKMFEDILLTKIIHDISLDLNFDLYYPSKHDSYSFIFNSIRSKDIRTIGIDIPKKYNVYRLSSLFNIIVSGNYPVGLPKILYPDNYMNYCNDLYIALCKITIKNDIKIPVLDIDYTYIYDDTSYSSYSFFTVLTSIDISLISNIGGYKIKEIFILKWEKSINIKNYMIKNIKNIQNITLIDGEKLINDISYKICLLPYKKNIYRIPNNILLFISFLSSYCRVKIHSLIKKIDNHYFGNNIINHNYIEMWTKNPVSDKDFLSETDKIK